jgi:hypothetical protein
MANSGRQKMRKHHILKGFRNHQQTDTDVGGQGLGGLPLRHPSAGLLQAQSAWVGAVNTQSLTRSTTSPVRACARCPRLLIGRCRAGARKYRRAGIQSRAGKGPSGRRYTDIRPDCTSGPLPAIRLAASPAHGAVAVKRGMLKATNLKQCLATEAPAFVAFYRATLDFRGSDQFALEITWPDGRKQIQRFRIDVGSSGGGMGI